MAKFCSHKTTVHQDRQVICCECGKKFGGDFKRHAESQTEAQQRALDQLYMQYGGSYGLSYMQPRMACKVVG